MEFHCHGTLKLVGDGLREFHGHGTLRLVGVGLWEFQRVCTMRLFLKESHSALATGVHGEFQSLTHTHHRWWCSKKDPKMDELVKDFLKTGAEVEQLIHSSNIDDYLKHGR